MCAKPVKNDPKKDVGTSGHSWDGIEELNTPLPRWWLWTFYLTILFALGYVIAYPAWPMLTRATPGLLGASTRADVAAEIKRFDDANAPIKAQLVAADMTAIGSDEALQSYAMKAGKAVFNTNCVQCHGREGGGNKAGGYPTLSDNDWLWGGDVETIYTTVSHGVRNTVDPEARNVGIYMPAWAETATGPLAEAATAQFTTEQIGQVVNYVLKISGQTADEAKATAGTVLYTENCAACHGEDGKGNPDLGSPNLTDAIWLYGGDEATLTATLVGGRAGVMPPWGYSEGGVVARLSEDELRAVTIYVSALGGN
jgi:cytochrome c oxidase cbb3-type subunit 3